MRVEWSERKTFDEPQLSDKKPIFFQYKANVKVHEFVRSIKIGIVTPKKKETPIIIGNDPRAKKFADSARRTNSFVLFCPFSSVFLLSFFFNIKIVTDSSSLSDSDLYF